VYGSVFVVGEFNNANKNFRGAKRVATATKFIQNVVNIRSRPDPFELEVPQSNRLSSFGTSGSNLTLTSPCALMWLQQSVHASLLCDRSVAYDILCRVQLCWP